MKRAAVSVWCLIACGAMAQAEERTIEFAGMRYRLGLTGHYSTHTFNWREGSVHFQSFHGHGEGDHLPAKSQLIEEWHCTSPDIPKAGREKLHINFWLAGGKPPTDSKEVELVIKGLKFTKH